MAEAKLEITDELLVAYVDEELDAAQRDMVSSALVGNPALGRRAEEMRLSRELLQEAFPLQPEASSPAPIEAAANRLAEACAKRSARQRFASLFRKQRKYAMVAGLVMAVAASAGYVVWQIGIEGTGRSVTALMRIDPETPLHRLLESTASAEVVNVPSQDAAMRAVLTFRAKDGRFCREFEILASAEGSTGIACRDQDGWHAEVMLSAAVAPPNSNYYTPAGDAESAEAAVAEVAERLMDGDPLGAEQEARLLDSGWRATPDP